MFKEKRYWKLSAIGRVARHLLESGAEEKQILRAILTQPGFSFDETVRRFDVGHFDISDLETIKKQVEWFTSLINLIAKYFGTRGLREYTNAWSAIVILLEWVYDLMQYRDAVRDVIGSPPDPDLTYIDIEYGHQTTVKRPGRPTGRDARGRFIPNKR